MTVNSYITLTTSDVGLSSGPTLSKRFKVIEGGYNITLNKQQSFDTTLDGIPDISQGGIYESYAFSLKVYQDDPNNAPGDSPWGTLSDLEQFYRYNNPLAPVSDILTMVDHFGNTILVVFMGQFSKVPVTVNLEGQNAVYFLTSTFQKVG